MQVSTNFLTSPYLNKELVNFIRRGCCTFRHYLGGYYCWLQSFGFRMREVEGIGDGDFGMSCNCTAARGTYAYQAGEEQYRTAWQGTGSVET